MTASTPSTPQTFVTEEMVARWLKLKGPMTQAELRKAMGFAPMQYERNRALANVLRLMTAAGKVRTARVQRVGKLVPAVELVVAPVEVAAAEKVERAAVVGEDACPACNGTGRKAT